MTIPGAAGGVKYIVRSNADEAEAVIEEMCQVMNSPERLLPGGYLYMNDILGNPQLMSKVGRLIASAYADQDINVVMTMATKGIPIAYAVAGHLNVPVVIVRRDNKVTEGPTVSINYISGSSKRIQTMLLSKRSLEQGSRVLVVDDFMKAGGTIHGMTSLLEEFDAIVSGIAVLIESEDTEERLVDQYLSLLKLSEVDMKDKKIHISKGNYFDQVNKG